jgi:hypothetical protein
MRSRQEKSLSALQQRVAAELRKVHEAAREALRSRTNPSSLAKLVAEMAM